MRTHPGDFDLKVSESVDRWIGRASALYGLWPIVPAGIAGIITSALAKGNLWLQSFGAFGIWCAGLLGFVLAAVGIWLAGLSWARFALAAATKKWSREVDAVNPLNTNFEKRRIKLEDFAHPVSRAIIGKNFSECELLGRANIIMPDGCVITYSGFMNCDVVIVKDSVPIPNAIALINCVITKCQIINCTIMITQQIYEQFFQHSNINLISYTAPANSPINSP